jgi:hypothetical protein
MEDTAMKIRPFWLRFVVDTTTVESGHSAEDTDPATDLDTDEPGDQDTPPKDSAAALGDPGKKALAAERKARRDAEKVVADLQAKVKAFEQRDLSETERLTTQLQEAQAAAATATAEALKLRIAAEVGLDPDLHEFLDGIADEEQMRARAQKLAAKATALAPKKAPDFGGGKRGDQPNSIASLDQQIAAAQSAGDHRLSIALKRQRQAAVAAGTK